MQIGHFCYFYMKFHCECYISSFSQHCSMTAPSTFAYTYRSLLKLEGNKPYITPQPNYFETADLKKRRVQQEKCSVRRSSSAVSHSHRSDYFGTTYLMGLQWQYTALFLTLSILQLGESAVSLRPSDLECVTGPDVKVKGSIISLLKFPHTPV